MKAKRSIVGVILVIGMLLTCVVSAYAGGTKPPKLAGKLADAKWGEDYEGEITVDGNTTSKDVTINVTITDTASADLKRFGFTVTNTSEGGLSITGKAISSDELFKKTSGYKFTVTATNQYEQKAGDGKWKNGKTTKDYTIKLKADAPKFTTKSLSSSYTKTGNEKNEIEITGALPMSIDVYIAGKDANKLGLGTKDIYIFSNDAQDNSASYTGLLVEAASSDSGMKLTITKEESDWTSYKNLPITIKAQNVVTAAKKKPVTKSYKVTSTGEAPTWVIARAPAKLGAATWNAPLTISDDFTEYMFTAKLADALSFEFKVSGDGPMKITFSPKDKTAGLRIVASNDAQSLDVYATSTSEAKTTKVKMTAENGDGKATITISFVGQDAPKIDYNKDKYYKDVEQDKKFSFTPKLKSGTKPIKWKIKSPTAAEITANPMLITSEDLKKSFDIEIDEDKGTLSGTPAKVTLSGDNKTFRRKTVLIYAENAAGSSDVVSVDIGVIGSKAKLEKDSKAISITRGIVVSGDAYTLKADDITSKDLIWSITPKGGKKKLSDYLKGLELSADGMLSGEPTEAGKASIPVTIDHFGAKSTASVKVTVYDPTPSIVSTDNGIITITNVTVDKSKHKTQKPYTKTMTLKMSDDMKATGKSKIKWKVSKPSEKALSVKLVKGSDKNANNVTLQVTLGKGKELNVNSDESNDVVPFEDAVEITATNSGAEKGSDSHTITIKIRVASGDAYPTTSDNPEDYEEETIGETAVIEDDVVTNEDLTAELGEGEVTLGAERTVGMLTSGQAAILDEGRFVIAAILPEVSATADGQYGFEVDLADTVKAGAKLYWFAFPKDAEASEDDEIIDFFEVDGTDTEVVPEDHVVAAYPWLRAGVTYGPVIAVKAEDAESGEAVTEEELEETAEAEAE